MAAICLIIYDLVCSTGNMITSQKDRSYANKPEQQ